MKRDQETLEKQLWEERQSIKKKHEEKVKVLKLKYVFRSSILLYDHPFYLLELRR